MNKLIDIIIPVYNAIDELILCINSIINKTEKNTYRIIAINDCSPDPRVADYLNTLEGHDSIVILDNKVNLGFVGTVNRGMKYSDNDVVLLNSDTEVTSGWLSKLERAAYQNSSVGTVTPLTNNGTICSVPVFLEDNEIPEGYNADSFANFIEKISLRRFPEIPTAVGFCMFIKRAVIKEIGYFDEETFGKGYAEENDFCCRVIESGYINIIADDTFVFHKGSMSFQGDKLKLLNKNIATLNRRYPYYEKKVHDFIVNNTLKDIHDNINAWLNIDKETRKSDKNILFILHNFFDEKYNHPIGGTEYHVKDLVEGLGEFNSYVLVSSGKELVLKHFITNQLIEKYRFPLKNELSLTHFHHQEYSEIVEKILITFGINLVHIHHLIKHSFDIPYISKKHDIKVIYTLHDYYLLCPKVNLMDHNNEYCKDKRSEEKCRECMFHTHGFHTPFLSKWKLKVEEMLEYVDLFITPSNYSKNIFEEEYPQIRGRIKAIPHGIDVSQNNNSFINNRREDNKPLSVGFLGGLSSNKGSEIIHKLILNYPKNKAEWHLIGALGDQRLNLINQDNVSIHGNYNRQDIDNILGSLDLDLICLLSPWPETFSYTLSEAWRCNIPVLVTPMGALKERVLLTQGGWISDSVKVEDIAKMLDFIYKNRGDITSKRNNILANKVETIHEMQRKYLQIYADNIVLQKGGGEGLSRQELLASLRYFQPDVVNGQHDYEIDQLKSELYAIHSTIGWKVLNRLRTRNKTALRIGKKLIYLVLKYRKRYKNV
ncbi:glycosyl transferase [Paenibacillus sp. J31TS4]|uniref:glycosyltransferase n=1 Tax=Paenibacillus sp. J31TS4 TaxID=2807195 RepID=UPI001B1CA1E1|nr:glycosyltransferase [Paenibacillus sp. J31TS4]GIP39961.1 glycosyl transferase [Paenibacillus sp. J31TS4]